MLKQRKIDGERRVFQDRSVDLCLHNTEKVIPVCQVCSETAPSVFLQYNYRLVRGMECQTSQSPNAAANQLDIF